VLIQVRTLADVGLSLLGEMAQPAFKVWDVVDTVDTMSIDLANQTPFDVALENIYSLAYRYAAVLSKLLNSATFCCNLRKFRHGPLSNPLLAPAHRIGKIKSEQLEEFAASRLTASEAVLVCLLSLIDCGRHILKNKAVRSRLG